MRKKIVRVCLLLSMVFICTTVFSQCGNSTSDGKRVIRIAHAQNESHPEHEALLKLKDYIEENGDGKFDIQIYPNELLGAQSQSVELTQTGAVDMAIVGLGVLEAFNDVYTIFNLPYIMDSVEYYHAVMNDKEIMDSVFEATKDSGFVGLTWFDAGVRNIYTIDKPIMTPDDLKGLKIRVQTSPTNVKMLEALGASATPMSFGEVYTGLQQGVIDGAENNELALVNNKHGEVAKCYSYNMHAMLPDILVMSTSLLEDLTEDEKQLFYDAAEYATNWEVEEWQKCADEAKAKAEEMGVQFYYPDIKPFQEKMESLHEEYTKKPEMKKVFDEIRAKGDELKAEKEGGDTNGQN